ncbi:hypothetical protein M4R22_15350 [Acidovorax sp. GBBC 3334]|uniref:hypothetical protein n=1 Tax=Acidovorax sp. GBBC 3334 TaxID=2940496 RepID=UPI00230432BE|nr:hypothetical protein [Acidovorax sp. GBBC 3334]MDA8456144.1 hypothetical protein [Acidovorax sp. GBBC 3334]
METSKGKMPDFQGEGKMELLLTQLAIFQLCIYVVSAIVFFAAAYYVTRAAVRDGIRDAMPRRPFDHRSEWKDTQDLRAER